MMTIGTLGILYPNREGKEYLYSELNEPQKKAIALYLKTLSALVDLDSEDKTIVQRALDKYWHQFC